MDNQYHDGYGPDQVALLEEIAANSRKTMRETVRIRKNIVFFFWLTIISMFGWVFGLIIFGSLAALFGSQGFGM